MAKLGDKVGKKYTKANSLGLIKFYQEKPLQSKLIARPIKRKVQKKKAIEKLHEKWFFNMPQEYFLQMCDEWNDKNLTVELPALTNYDDWFNYFKTLTPTVIRRLAQTGLDILSTEAYAALSRWHDIISNPHRIDKIHQSGLTYNNGTKKESIISLAQSNDRLGVLKATRDKIAEKLDKGAGARDTAALTREMTEIMTQIADYEKRMGPKKKTKLGRLLDDAEKLRSRPSHGGTGTRKTSFASRVSIKQVEDLQ